MDKLIYEQQKYVQSFQAEFELRYGYSPEVKLEEQQEYLKRTRDLSSLEDIVNSFNRGKDVVRSRVRTRKAVSLRTIYTMLCVDKGLTYKFIGDSMDRHHSSVIYAKNSGYDLLETDKNFRDLYIQISTLVNPKIYPHARISEVPDEKSSYGKSAGSVGVHQRKYKVTRPDPRSIRGSK